MNVTLRFKNRDASGDLEDISLNVDRDAVKHIMAWYGAYFAGDDYDVFVNGRKQAMDKNGEFEPVTLEGSIHHNQLEERSDTVDAEQRTPA